MLYCTTGTSSPAKLPYSGRRRAPEKPCTSQLVPSHAADLEKCRVRAQAQGSGQQPGREPELLAECRAQYVEAAMLLDGLQDQIGLRKWGHDPIERKNCREPLWFKETNLAYYWHIEDCYLDRWRAQLRYQPPVGLHVCLPPSKGGLRYQHAAGVHLGSDGPAGHACTLEHQSIPCLLLVTVHVMCTQGLARHLQSALTFVRVYTSLAGALACCSSSDWRLLLVSLVLRQPMSGWTVLCRAAVPGDGEQPDVVLVHSLSASLTAGVSRLRAARDALTSWLQTDMTTTVELYPASVQPPKQVLIMHQLVPSSPHAVSWSAHQHGMLLA